MDKLKREYDRFGPWDVEIKEKDDIPQQFINFTDIIMKGILSFKVPVNVERRNLKPGMLLYQTVTSLTEDSVIILKRTETEIDRQKVRYKDILYLQYTTDMLFGGLILATAKQRYVIDFNPAKHGPAEEALNLIREKYCDLKPRINYDHIQKDVDVQSFLFETLLSQEMEKEDLKLISYQPSIKLHRKRADNLKYWKIVSEEEGLQDSVYLTNGKELIVLSRVKDVKAVKKADYGYCYTYIPLGHIRSLLIESNETMAKIQELSIVMEDIRLVFIVDNRFSVKVLKDVLKQ